MTTTLVKMGGSLLEDATLRASAMDAVADAAARGERLVIVHGGGRHIDRELSRRGVAKQTVNGLRITDAETLEVVTSVLAGLVNKSLVAELRRRGVPSAGVSGVDGALIQASLHPPVDGVDPGFVGLVDRVDSTLVELLLTGGYLPVIACIASDAAGHPLNVNADAAASAVAVAMRSHRIVYLTDVEGYLAPDGAVVGELSLAQCRQMLASGALTGGMHPKIVSIIHALEGGVGEAVIAGPSRHATVLLNGEGGTRLVAA